MGKKMMTRKRAIAALESRGYDGAIDVDAAEYALRVLHLLDALTPAQRAHLIEDVAYCDSVYRAKGEPEVADGYRKLAKLLRMR